jgi:hypothetical protein
MLLAVTIVASVGTAVASSLLESALFADKIVLPITLIVALGCQQVFTAAYVPSVSLRKVTRHYAPVLTRRALVAGLGFATVVITPLGETAALAAWVMASQAIVLAATVVVRSSDMRAHMASRTAAVLRG